MTDERNSSDPQPISELELARAIRELPREMEPSRDLWAGIERNIIDHPQPSVGGWKSDWVPYGVAASLVMAVSALALTAFVSLQPAEPTFVAFDDSMQRMESEYLRVRNPMVRQFNETNQNLDPVVLEDIYQNVEIMAAARRDIEAQIRENPDDQRLVEMLMRIHEQELALLKQDFTQPRSM